MLVKIRVNAGSNGSIDDVKVLVVIGLSELTNYAKKNKISVIVEKNVQQTTAIHQIELSNIGSTQFNDDHYRLEQVINNLLTNAIKYSPNGEKVLVNATIENTDLRVTIQDFGIGIAKEHFNNLFDRYYRVDNTAMRFEGLGLGLFISSEITKRYNGQLHIESELGKGTTVFLKLPLA